MQKPSAIIYLLSILLSLAPSRVLAEDADTAVMRAALMKNDVPAVTACLSRGVSPDGVPDAFLIAARVDAYESAKLLLDRGATNLNILDLWMDWRETPLTKALKLGNRRTALLYISRGAAVDVPTKYGWTALMFAVRVNDTEIADALIARGAKVNATNAEGYSPLMIAADRGHTAMVKKLLEHGADANHETVHGVTAMRLALNRNDTAAAQLILKRTSIRSVPLMEMYPLAAKESASDRRGTNGAFSYAVQHPSVTLSYGGDRPDERISLSILPDVGNRIISLRYGTNELLYADTNIAKLYSEGGIPILYPTPNKVENGTFTFDGRTVVMKHPLTPYPAALHGIVMDDRWNYAAPEFVPGGIAFKAWYVVDANNPRFPAFPWVHRLTVTYTLMKDRVRIAYEVRNSDSTRFGFGFGLHPYWRITGAIRIQADIPSTIKDMTTGTILPVTPENDLRTVKTLSRMTKINEMYYRLVPKKTVAVFHDDIGLSLQHEASDAFTHLVVWTPEGKPFFAVEHQTSSADAHNLYAKGGKDVSHLIIVAPGETAAGYTEYILKRRP